MGVLIRISRSLIDAIVVDALAQPGSERCGLLLGGVGEIVDFVPAANVHTDPSRHFEIDPMVLIEQHRAMRHGAAAVVGHYHSHPVGAAEPSPADAGAAHGDGQIWLIVTPDAAQFWRAVRGGDHLGQFTALPYAIVADGALACPRAAP